jgi:hypothetical protein
MTTRKAIENHIISLADAYSTHWIHRGVSGRFIPEFLTVEAEAFPEEFTLERSQKFEAQLSPGWYDSAIPEDDQGDEPTHAYGFTASVWETTKNRGRKIWDRPYPMDDVPIPAFLRDRIREE